MKKTRSIFAVLALTSTLITFADEPSVDLKPGPPDDPSQRTVVRGRSFGPIKTPGKPFAFSPDGKRSP